MEELFKVPIELDDQEIKRDMLDLTRDLVLLFKTKYPGLLNAFQQLPEEKMIELMIELCDVFDLYRDTAHKVAALYQEHRRRGGSLEDRDWPEN